MIDDMDESKTLRELISGLEKREKQLALELAGIKMKLQAIRSALKITERTASRMPVHERQSTDKNEATSSPPATWQDVMEQLFSDGQPHSTLDALKAIQAAEVKEPPKPYINTWIYRKVKRKELEKNTDRGVYQRIPT